MLHGEQALRLWLELTALLEHLLSYLFLYQLHTHYSRWVLAAEEQ
jgi:hypothetical protein